MRIGPAGTTQVRTLPNWSSTVTGRCVSWCSDGGDPGLARAGRGRSGEHLVDVALPSEVGHGRGEFLVHRFAFGFQRAKLCAVLAFRLVQDALAMAAAICWTSTLTRNISFADGSASARRTR